MQDFPGNSEKAKRRSETPPPDERPKIEQVTSAQAEQRKRGLGRKFKETFVIGSMRDTADYMFTDVVVPGIRDILADAAHAVTDRMIYGDSTRSRRPTAPSAYSAVGRVDYQSMSKPLGAQTNAQRMISRRSRSRHDFGEIIIDSRAEAAEVIEQMFEYLSRFGEVKVSDLYDMTGIQSSHVDHKWGWTALPGAKPVRMRDGRWLLNLPEPDALN